MQLELKIKSTGTAQESDLKPILAVLEEIDVGNLGKITISDGAGRKEEFEIYSRIVEMYKETGEITFTYSGE